MAPHPYLPRDIVLPGYHPVVMPLEKLLTIFFGCAALVVLGAWFFTGTVKGLSRVDRLWSCWFLCSGIIHFLVEGTVVLNSKFYTDTTGNILNEIWREYAKADSRYATRDAFVIQMEGVTAFAWGPLCFLVFYGLLTRKAWRFTAMFIVSMGQLYGDVLYYLTCLHEGLDKHTRPEPLYFWFYFVFMNAIWIVLPTLNLAYCASHINAAIAATGSAKKKQ